MTISSRRASLAGVASAAAGPLAGGTVLLLSDALGGVVKVPGDVVTYMALTGLVLACAGALAVPRLAGRFRAHRVTAVGGVLAGLAVAVAGAAPAVPVFASGVMAAGLLASPLLAAPRARAARSPGAAAWGQAAALGGAAAAAWVATLWSADPGTALLVAGVAGAVLALAASAAPEPAGSERPVARGVLRDVRAALPVHLLVGWTVGASLMGGLHLLTFRWDLIGDEPVRYLAWALMAGAVLAVLGRRAAGAAQTVPWLLLAGAAAPLLMATAPGPAMLAAGFAVVLAAACLATAALDATVLRPLPESRLLAAAGLTGAAAALGGLAGFGCAAALRGVLAEGSALAVTAVPPVLGALLALRVRGPEPDPAPFLHVQGLSVPRGTVPLRRAGLTVAAGEIVALSGPGAGTLLAALAGAVPCRGKVRLGGADLTALDAGQRMRLGLCHHAGPAPRVPDGRPVAEGLAAHARDMGHADPGSAARAVLEVFPALRGLGGEPVRALSAAQRDLLALAEALLTRPRLLLVDGIAAGPGAGAVHTVLRRLAATGTAVLVAAPAAPEIRALACRGYTVGRDRVTETPVPAAAPATARRTAAAGSTGGSAP
ncbi:ABC-type branched-chain amino acid transport system, ATPase component [Actinomadura meyerae]|uniref:ABC-type branched-chain amino acid transport system, ATPase component n=1 Tax=Actinomadura meyerae TaxID=240840 RepID=A0A239M6V9_9ACTN|nr:ATP-binding cassette domain-containing protein [Actinomadura meyerae]SNT38475.1 ABC-type branched-chain amino acid transport system, ATPase component [Actinomadura meyerae]